MGIIDERIRRFGCVFIFLFFAIICFSDCCNRCFGEDVLSLVRVGKGKAADIDGDLSEDIWSKCGRAIPFVKANGAGLAEVQSSVSLYYDEENLYIGFVCDEPNVKQLRRNLHVHDSGIWADDCVEIFLQVPGSKEICHIVVNSLAVVYDAKDGDVSWESGAKVAVKVNKDSWAVEMALPWSAVGVVPREGEEIRVNFCRERKGRKGELSAWSCPYGGFHKPERLGRLILGDSAVCVKSLKISAPRPGANAGEIIALVPRGMNVVLNVAGKGVLRFVGENRFLRKTFYYPVGVSGDVIDFELSAKDVCFWRAVVPIRLQPPCALGDLRYCVSQVAESVKNLPKKSQIRRALIMKLGQAKRAESNYLKAIAKSLQNRRPIAIEDYKKMNEKLRRYYRELSGLLWPIWHKNNWDDVSREELPKELSDVGVFHYPVLVNEYQSGNFIVTNLRSSALRVRVIPSSVVWFCAKDNVLENGNFAKDADKDGVPDGWRISSRTNIACMKMLSSENRKHVLFIDYSKAGASKEVFLLQDVRLRPGKRYLIQFKIKAENGANVRVSVINEGWKDDRGTGVLPGDCDWRIVRKVITAPPGEKQRFIVLSHRTGGRIWLSDFYLIPYDKVARFEDAVPQIRVADWQELRGGGKRADVLVPLNSAGRLDIPAMETRQIWLTFGGKDLPPGIYTGNVELRPLASRANPRPLSKRVYFELDCKPIRLETFPRFRVYNWDYAENEAQVRDLYEHKVNVFLCGIPFPQYNKDGSVARETDFSETDRILRIKMRYARKGHGAIMFSYGVIRGFYHHAEKKFGWKFMGEKWKRAFVYGYKRWLEHIKELGLKYDEFYVQVWDEAMKDRLRYVIAGGKLLRQIDPNVRLVMDGEQPIELAKQMNPYIDVWIPVLHCLTDGRKGRELLRWYKQTGKPIWTYTCQVRMKALPVYRYYRLKAWNAAKLDLDGVCYWAYNSWRGDSWNDFDSYRGDNGVIYSGMRGEPIDSRRWEASREGLEDWQIIRLVRGFAKEMSENDSQAILKQVDECIDDVLGKPSDVGKADEARLKLISLAIRLSEMSQGRQLRISNVKGGKDEKAKRFCFSCRTNRSAAGKLIYRFKGERVWKDVSVSRGVLHEIALNLPAGVSRVEWIALFWDQTGRVAFVCSRF